MSAASMALVTGATGFIGRTLVARLRQRGTPVAVVTRQVRAVFPPDVRVHVADLASGEGLSPAVAAGVGTVFHCAGEVRDTTRMYAAHVQGTARLLAAVVARPAQPPLRWVQLSSVGAYGPPRAATERRVIDEASPEAPAGVYENTKTEADALVRQISAEAGLTWSLLRPTAVIGATMTNGSLRALVAMVRRGWFVYPGPDDAIANYVHVDDVVAGLLACADDSRAAGHVFIVSSDCPWTALVAEVASALGVRAPAWRLPHSLLSAAARGAESLGAPLTVGRVNALAGRTRYASDKIEQMLGFSVSRPLPQAVRDVVEAAR